MKNRNWIILACSGLLVCGPAYTAKFIVSKEMQKQISMEAHSQRTAAVTAQIKVSGGLVDYEKIKAPLEAAIARWEALPAPALVKESFSSCAAMSKDMLELMESEHTGQITPSAASQKQKQVNQDHDACRLAMRNPDAAFRAQAEASGSFSVE